MAKVPNKRPRTDVTESEAGPSRKRLDVKPSNETKLKGKSSEKNSKSASKGSSKVDPDESVEDEDEAYEDDSEDGQDLLRDEEIGAISGESDTESDEDDDDEDDSDDGDGSDEADEEDDDIPVSLEDCLENPLYALQDPESDAEAGFVYQACILCPSKILKNQIMVDVHLKSNTHARSKRRMAERLLDPDSLISADPRVIVAEIEEKLAESRTTHPTPKQQKQTNRKDTEETGETNKPQPDVSATSKSKAKKGNRRNKVAQQIEQRKARRAAKEAEAGSKV